MPLNNFLSFEYFATLLLQKDEINIQVYPNLEGNKELLNSIASVLLRKMPYSEKDQRRKVVLQGVVQEDDLIDDKKRESTISDLSTVNKLYGYSGLFRGSPFDVQEELIFGKFCSHISLTLEKIRLFDEIKMFSIHDGTVITNCF